jgi:hypothetical protein
MLNPDDQEKALQEFIARHVKPYDPVTDQYERPPFAADELIVANRSDRAFPPAIRRPGRPHIGIRVVLTGGGCAFGCLPSSSDVAGVWPTGR